MIHEKKQGWWHGMTWRGEYLYVVEDEKVRVLISEIVCGICSKECIQGWWSKVSWFVFL
ncbi:uncharacterized protein BO96DRAFT_43085 [Aspergillus niger CBS 101883]|uniref:uncharacterized protein n=1 Tax=Aspergillus lacticoffeatus (strain CBS 101883) TaxID=1450533 RepID=UPI000D7FF4D2|nr:uncharacterized protein BO96DRAFT_43085 [Aspergillus niger CBS 101883]PYH56921.1 hypothetical protein BO96DRAFT_43085 [Aspergillus niger CBS 101883]